MSNGYFKNSFNEKSMTFLQSVLSDQIGKRKKRIGQDQIQRNIISEAATKGVL